MEIPIEFSKTFGAWTAGGSKRDRRHAQSNSKLGGLRSDEWLGGSQAKTREVRQRETIAPGSRRSRAPAGSKFDTLADTLLPWASPPWAMDLDEDKVEKKIQREKAKPRT
jgi:hypothetical protein